MCVIGNTSYMTIDAMSCPVMIANTWLDIGPDNAKVCLTVRQSVYQSVGLYIIFKRYRVVQLLEFEFWIRLRVHVLHVFLSDNRLC